VVGDPLVDLAETGAAVAAWRELRGDAGSVMVQERRADGVPETASVSAPRGGLVNGLRLGGSGRGDAIVAFHQGGQSFGQLAAVVVDAPPSDFFILLPDRWQRKRSIPVSWDPSLNAVSPVAYTVSVDDEPVKEGVHGLSARLRPSQIGNGVHKIQIFAVDGAGQETGSQTGRLKVDRKGPRARIRVRGRSVSVRITDGARRRTSGVRRSSTRISFGDGGGRASVLRAGHVYSRAGRYRIVVRARDRAGNRTLIRRWVRVG